MHTEAEPVPGGTDTELETGHMRGPAEAGPGGAATQFADIIERAESSARDYLENVRQQSEAIIEQAEADARRRQVEMIAETQRDMADLTSATESMLQEADELRNSLEGATATLGQASARLREHVDTLLSDDGGGDGFEPEAEDGAEPSYPPPERRRFGLR